MLKQADYLRIILVVVLLFPLYASLIADCLVYKYGDTKAEYDVVANIDTYEFGRGPRNLLIIFIRLRQAEYTPAYIELNYAYRDVSQFKNYGLGKDFHANVLYKQNNCAVCLFSKRIMPVYVEANGRAVVDRQGAYNYFIFNMKQQGFLVVTFTMAGLIVILGFHFSRFFKR